MIAILKFNQQDNSDRINKHPKHQIITVNNNQFGALHFINAPYKSSDRTTRAAIALQRWLHHLSHKIHNPPFRGFLQKKQNGFTSF